MVVDCAAAIGVRPGLMIGAAVILSVAFAPMVLQQVVAYLMRQHDMEEEVAQTVRFPDNAGLAARGIDMQMGSVMRKDIEIRSAWQKRKSPRGRRNRIQMNLVWHDVLTEDNTCRAGKAFLTEADSA